MWAGLLCILAFLVAGALHRWAPEVYGLTVELSGQKVTLGAGLVTASFGSLLFALLRLTSGGKELNPVNLKDRVGSVIRPNRQARH